MPWFLNLDLQNFKLSTFLQDDNVAYLTLNAYFPTRESLTCNALKVLSFVCAVSWFNFFSLYRVFVAYVVIKSKPVPFAAFLDLVCCSKRSITCFINMFLLSDRVGRSHLISSAALSLRLIFKLLS